MDKLCIAVEINKQTGCHQLLNIQLLPRTDAIALFHSLLPAYENSVHDHLSRQLFEFDAPCGAGGGVVGNVIKLGKSGKV
jgi:hypothetical protein